MWATFNDYTLKHFSVTADGASVNFGQAEGLLKKLEDDKHPWLVKIQYVNHHVELALKDALAYSLFNDADNFYIDLYYLLNNSGAIKPNIQAVAKTLNISHYVLPKMTVTHFVSHCKKLLAHLLNTWPAIITTLENTIAVRLHKNKTKKKIQGFLKQMKSYSFLCLVSTYINISEKTTLT